MAERRGSGGRGGVATDAPSPFDLEDFDVVDETEELSRSAAKPSEHRPLVELALADLNRKIERRTWVEVPGEDGEEPTRRREPVTYSKPEAQAMYDGLRAAADQMKLPQARKRSLRIVVSPKLDKGSDDDRFRVQWYAIRLGKNDVAES